MVEVTATIGGAREHTATRRVFLVPSEDYGKRSFAFVVDPRRNVELLQETVPSRCG